MATTDPGRGSSVRWVRLAAACALVAAGVFWARGVKPERGWEWIDSLGPWAPVAFVGLYALAAAAMVPGSLLSLAAGAKWGLFEGLVYVIIGSNLGANGAFGLGRWLAREWVGRLMARRPKFSAVEAAVAAEGWKVVALLRLSPIFPFNVLNYALSLTRIRWGAYAMASFFGMLPGTVMIVYVGSAVGAAIRPQARSPWEWGLLAAGLVATVAVAVKVTRVARRALDRQLATPENPHGDESR